MESTGSHHWKILASLLKGFDYGICVERKQLSEFSSKLNKRFLINHPHCKGKAEVLLSRVHEILIIFGQNWKWSRLCSQIGGCIDLGKRCSEKIVVNDWMNLQLDCVDLRFFRWNDMHAKRVSQEALNAEKLASYKVLHTRKTILTVFISSPKAFQNFKISTG